MLRRRLLVSPPPRLVCRCRPPALPRGHPHRLGIFSSATRRTVLAALQKLQGNLELAFRQWPDRKVRWRATWLLLWGLRLLSSSGG